MIQILDDLNANQAFENSSLLVVRVVRCAYEHLTTAEDKEHAFKQVCKFLSIPPGPEEWSAVTRRRFEAVIQLREYTSSFSNSGRASSVDNVPSVRENESLEQIVQDLEQFEKSRRDEQNPRSPRSDAPISGLQLLLSHPQIRSFLWNGRMKDELVNAIDKDCDVVPAIIWRRIENNLIRSEFKNIADQLRDSGS